jgi:hypothetical protein
MRYYNYLISKIIYWYVWLKYSKKDTRRKIADIEKGILEIVQPLTSEHTSVWWYGAYDIHPKHLVFWICITTDATKQRFEADIELLKKLRFLLEFYDYPIIGREGVHIGFASEETVQRESKGNWFYHFK